MRKVRILLTSSAAALCIDADRTYISTRTRTRSDRSSCRYSHTFLTQHPLLTSHLAHDADARLMVICHDQTADQTSIQKLAGLLSAADPAVPYHLWIEHPENVPTCLALAPNRRESKIKKALDKSGARLWKG